MEELVADDAELDADEAELTDVAVLVVVLVLLELEVSVVAWAVVAAVTFEEYLMVTLVTLTRRYLRLGLAGGGSER